ncbi:MAG: hypothetical protein ACR2NW_01785 [Thermodesulfobacteriota bacterium]
MDIYGSEIEGWPPEAREGALELLLSSHELTEIVENEKQFEKLLNEREFEDPSSDLERRITLLADSTRPKAGSVSLWSSLSELFYVPKPALAIAFIMIFGFFLGFFYDSYANGVDELELSDLMHYEDDGGYYEQQG